MNTVSSEIHLCCNHRSGVIVGGVDQISKGEQKSKRGKARNGFLPCVELSPASIANAIPETERKRKISAVPNATDFLSSHDFWANVSAAELARAQGVQRVESWGKSGPLASPIPRRPTGLHVRCAGGVVTEARAAPGEEKGRPVDTGDALIAACAVSFQIPLLTNNKRHFDGIDELTVVSAALGAGS
jgi:hypothetical protein